MNSKGYLNLPLKLLSHLNSFGVVVFSQMSSVPEMKNDHRGKVQENLSTVSAKSSL